MSIRTHIIKSTMLLSSLFIIGQIAEATTVDVGGSIRPRVEYVNQGGQGLATDGTNMTHTTMQTRLNVKATVDENVSAFIQIQDVRTWGGEVNSGLPPSLTRTGTSTSGNVDFHQAYFIVKDALGTGLNLKVGRQEMVFDEARLIGNIGWIQQAQSFDAVRVDTRRDNVSFTGFYSQTWASDTHPTLQSTTVATSAKPAGPESSFVGGRATYHMSGKDRITGYIYSAFDPIIGTGTTPLLQELHTAGLYAAKTFGGVRLRFDGAFQFGEVTDTQEVDAYMITFSAGKNLDIAHGARIEFWADVLSGDDGTDATKQTKFTIPYGTNHKFYGHADKFLNNPTQGLVDLAIKFWVKPTAKIKLVAHAHNFRADTLNPTAGINSEKMGSEIDLQAHYALAKNTKVVLGYSHFSAAAANTATSGGGVGGNPTFDTDWAFAMMISKF